MKEIASGVWPVMITPFTADNKVDYDAVLRIIPVSYTHLDVYKRQRLSKA